MYVCMNIYDLDVSSSHFRCYFQTSQMNRASSASSDGTSERVVSSAGMKTGTSTSFRSSRNTVTEPQQNSCDWSSDSPQVEGFGQGFLQGIKILHV